MNRLVALIISLYIASFFYANVFFIKQLTIVESADQLFWNHLAIFAILLIPVYLLISPVISASYDKGAMKMLRLVVLSLGAAGLLITILYQNLNLGTLYDLPPQIEAFFTGDLALTIWLILPILALFI
ncbi:MAG: hypothetical protein Q7R67_01250 [bacterium]|nr:hypothetical protein [bacterium]